MSSVITTAPDPTVKPGFGASFAPKMSICWYRNQQWEPLKVQALQPFSLHPAAHVFHYASTCFEGLKAYLTANGQVQIFRLQRHAERMQATAEALCLPKPGVELFTTAVLQAVAACRDAVPEPPGSLYIRPVLMGCDNNIGAAASRVQEACFYVLLSPVGDYFSGDKPLKILLDDKNMRSPPGFGVAKAGANYAAALRHIETARAEYGVDQVLFCPGGDVQETGASNFMLLRDKQLLTKPLDDSFLPGVTRDSVLKVAADLGYEVLERDFTVDELLDWTKTGEAALSGTAAVLAGIGSFVYQGREITVHNGQIGPHTLALRKALVDIQLGKTNDIHTWLTSV